MTKIDKKILIVEDETDMREALRDKLSLDGFDILETADGEEGLEAALREHPDLILLDIIMPKMDGLTMLKHLREDAWGKNAKVILLTNLSDNKTVSSAIEHDTYDYLVKSDWKISDVVDKVRVRLGVKKP